MIRLVVVHPLQLFISGLIPILGEIESVNLIGEFSKTEELLPLLKTVTADILLIAERITGAYETISRMIDRNPDLKIILFIPDYGDEHLSKMVEYGTHSVLLESNNATGIIETILAVNEGREHLPEDIVQKLKNLNREQHSRTLKIKLTPREQEVLDCIGRGMAKPIIVRHLNIEMNTLNSHLKNLYSKFAVHDIHQLEHKARRLRYIKDNS